MSKRELKEKKKKEEKSQTTERHSGHGSITKAGKVRAQTPKIEKTNTEKHKGPSLKNRQKYKAWNFKKHQEELEAKDKRRVRLP